MKPLVETDWLIKNLENVRIFDASLHLPNVKRKAQDEFNKMHIHGATFFDINKHSNKNSSLPHMMPDIDQWQKTLSNFGVKKEDHVIIYDNSNLYSSCRLWFNFIYFGHDSNLVSVLNGGLRKWLKENKKVTSSVIKFKKSSYIAKEKKNLILERQDIDKNILSKKFKLIDARSQERFLGKIPEPRKGLKSGSIPGSKNLPYRDCIDKNDNTFKKVEDLRIIFDRLNLGNNIAFTCGSGITACVLGLANSLINDTNPIVYDESWSGYGLKNDYKK
tara:strand:- start:149 stop:973 length:825 start_codon:yes stop_codon:yes gene_type:complete